MGQRIDQFREDLRQMSVALSCQFSSHASFNRAFRRAIGVTPGEYQRARRWSGKAPAATCAGADKIRARAGKTRAGRQDQYVPRTRPDSDAGAGEPPSTIANAQVRSWFGEARREKFAGETADGVQVRCREIWFGWVARFLSRPRLVGAVGGASKSQWRHRMERHATRYRNLRRYLWQWLSR